MRTRPTRETICRFSLNNKNSSNLFRTCTSNKIYFSVERIVKNYVRSFIIKITSHFQEAGNNIDLNNKGGEILKPYTSFRTNYLREKQFFKKQKENISL